MQLILNVIVSAHARRITLKASIIRQALNSYYCEYRDHSVTMADFMRTHAAQSMRNEKITTKLFRRRVKTLLSKLHDGESLSDALDFASKSHSGGHNRRLDHTHSRALKTLILDTPTANTPIALEFAALVHEDQLVRRRDVHVHTMPTRSMAHAEGPLAMQPPSVYSLNTVIREQGLSLRSIHPTARKSTTTRQHQERDEKEEVRVPSASHEVGSRQGEKP